MISVASVLSIGIVAALMFVTLWQYQNTMQVQRRNIGIWSGAQQYAKTLLKKDKKIENDWLIGDESWRDGKNTYQIRLTYYADADAEKEGRESEYQYTIHFDETEGYLIKSEGVPEKKWISQENNLFDREPPFVYKSVWIILTTCVTRRRFFYGWKKRDGSDDRQAVWLTA